MSRRGPAVLGLLAALAAAVMLLAPAVGPVPLAPAEVLRAILHPDATDPVTVQIVHLRLARVVLGFLVGGGLAVAGSAFQTLLANPLATPYTLGLASAGAFGAFLSLATSLGTVLGPAGSVPAQAFLWCALEAGLLTLLARRVRWGASGLILAGVTLNFVFAAATVLLRLVADPFRLHSMDRWLLGGLDVVGWRAPAWAAGLGLPAVAVLLLSAPALDQLVFGDAVAHGRGVRVARVRAAALLAGAWVTAACVAWTGPIAFVGLLVPHGVRLVMGPGHRLGLPAALLAGGSFLVVCDTAARTLPLLGRGTELPVGVLTALLGGPVFLALLAGAGRAGRGEGPGPAGR